MLDAHLQQKLTELSAAAGTRSQYRATAIALIAALSGIVIGAISALHLAGTQALRIEHLERLTVIISERDGTVPIDLWIALQKKMKKDLKSLSTQEQLVAIDFLISRANKYPQQDILPIW